MNKKSTVISEVSLYDGRHQGDKVREADPNGSTTVHDVNRTQRLIDRLYRDKVLDADLYDIASELRDLHEKATLIPSVKAADVSRPIGSGGEGEINSGAWGALMVRLKKLRPGNKKAVINYCFFDQPLGELKDLISGLETLRDR